MSGGIVGWINQFLIVGVAFFVSAFFLINNKSNKWFTLLFLLAPFQLIAGGIVLGDALFGYPNPSVYPIVTISIISAFLGLGIKLLYLKYSKKIVIIFASLYLALFIVGGYIFMCNWLHYVFNKKHVLQTEQLSDIQIWDFSDNEIKLEKMENKVIILDFWNIHCGVCFRQFPDLEKINNYYHNKEVVVYAVYVPWHYEDEDNNLENRLKRIEAQNFTFNVVKTDTATANKIGIKAVPHLLVFDKNKKIALDSNLEFFEKRFIMNDIYSVIDKLLEE